MTPQGANNAVIVSSVVTLGSTTGASLTSGNGIHGKTVVGGFFAMAGCAVLTELDPNLGGYLAILIAVGAFIYYGLPLMENLGFKKSGLSKKEEEEKVPGIIKKQEEEHLHLRKGAYINRG